MNDLMTLERNFKAYRDMITRYHETQQPALPFMGVYLRDLLFTEEGNQQDSVDENNNVLINFSKRQLIARTIQQIEQFREWYYSWYRDNLPPTNDQLTKLLHYSIHDSMTSEEAYEKSLAIESSKNSVGDQTRDRSESFASK